MLIDGVDMLEVREAASLARRTPETVRRWVWSGRLSAVKKGNRLLVRRDELDALIQGETGPRGATPTLREWRDEVASRLTRPTGGTARDLVLDDRRDGHVSGTKTRARP
jgi:excisionase family DNA binding protein